MIRQGETTKMGAKVDLVGGHLQIKGQVQFGDQRGRILGFPTANLVPEQDSGVLVEGVYAGWCWRANGTVWKAAVSVGRRPSFKDKGTSDLVVEAHLLDFQGNLYGEVISIRLIEQLRLIVAFDNVEALVDQIRIDIQLTRDRLR